MNYPEEARKILRRYLEAAAIADRDTRGLLGVNNKKFKRMILEAETQALSQLCELVRESVGEERVPNPPATADTWRSGVFDGENQLRDDIRTKWTLKEVLTAYENPTKSKEIG